MNSYKPNLNLLIPLLVLNLAAFAFVYWTYGTIPQESRLYAILFTVIWGLLVHFRERFSLMATLSIPMQRVAVFAILIGGVVLISVSGNLLAQSVSRIYFVMTISMLVSALLLPMMQRGKAVTK